MPTFNDSAALNIEAAKKYQSLFISFLSLTLFPLLSFLTALLIFLLTRACISILDEKQHQSVEKKKKRKNEVERKGKERVAGLHLFHPMVFLIINSHMEFLVSFSC